MKKLTKVLLTVAVAAVLTPCAPALADAPQREHRAIWMTTYLNDWPSGSITESNASTYKAQLEMRLEKFRDANINVLYYHCRSNCDATYDSAYEPWAASVSGKRGQAPAFDPFGYLVEKLHEYGIEVYAWLNPYRYCGTSKHGEGELNYENSHPEWLISQAKETILNPGLDEVKQRIVDVILDILSKYDVDGIIFDDYFYTNTTPMSLDADLYNKYKSSGGTLSQADWRRANVNDMVARVNAAIKAVKPYVVFAISPAGVASPPNVTSEYGLPAISGDWQYNAIYSDPLAWLKAGTIDFISPQIYWPSRFDSLTEWWARAAAKFNRHCYPSVDLSDINTYKYAEFGREVEVTRKYLASGTAGMVYFRYGNFINYSERVDGERLDFGALLGHDVYNTKALMPLHPWIKSDAPDMVTNVVMKDNTLSWTANSAGRYAVYKVPNNQTEITLTLDGITYTNSYTLPNDAANYNWYVAAYDRYANVSTPLGVGATKQSGSAPVLTYPANGESPVNLFEFKWQHESNLGLYTVELSDAADFGNILASMEAQGKSASVTGLPELTAGKTYYWRVKATDVNREHPVSAVSSFVAPSMQLIAPKESASVAINGTVSWTEAVEGATYTFEISKNSDMASPVHSVTLEKTSYTLPPYTLTTGSKYFARVTASLGDVSASSPIVAFTTENRSDYAAPKFVNPTRDGQTLYSNEVIEFEPWDGMSIVNIQIAESTSFPTRSMYTASIGDFATKSAELGTIKISSKNLTDGKTYYLRARGVYNLTTSSAAQYTDYTPVMTFVYSAQAGVSDLTADDSATYLAGTTLHVGKGVDTVTVYSLAGATVAVFEAADGTDIDLSVLTEGAYLVKAGATTLKLIR